MIKAIQARSYREATGLTHARLHKMLAGFLISYNVRLNIKKLDNSAIDLTVTFLVRNNYVVNIASSKFETAFYTNPLRYV